MYKKILVANRGEIACRIARSCRTMGIVPIGVHSSADRDALHVRSIGYSIEIGGASPQESYLNIQAIVNAAFECGADAVHPGYGFLSENPEFANALKNADIAFIGPSTEVLHCFGDKGLAKKEAIKAKIPVVPGTDTPTENVDELIKSAQSMPFPILLKAAGGGGGKGMRIVSQLSELKEAAEAAMRESENAFANGKMIVESFIQNARHIEVQVLGDGNGNAVHFYDRECSLQRRHQKVIEEAPASNISHKLREQLLNDAVRLCKQVNYLGLGTVEFIISDDKAYFLEVNPRLQVEHPVTECVTGYDLIQQQILAVYNKSLCVQQNEIHVQGVAFEARLCAEDPKQNFLPQTGQLNHVSFASDLRVDTGIDEGAIISSSYDSMIAKLISHEETREKALHGLGRGLHQTIIQGVTTNRNFLQDLIARDEILDGTIHTSFIDVLMENGFENDATAPPKEIIAAASTIFLQTAIQHKADSAWSDASFCNWRLASPNAPSYWPCFILCAQDQAFTVAAYQDTSKCELIVSIDSEPYNVKFNQYDDHYHLQINDLSLTCIAEITVDSIVLSGAAGQYHFSVQYIASDISGEGVLGDGRIAAPMMGQIVAVEVRPGEKVEAGDTILKMESMKMEFSVKASIAGYLENLNCRIGDLVERDQILAHVTTTSASEVSS